MDDLISRQAAIDAIVNRTVTVDTDVQWLSGHAKCEHEIIDIINALPSAQPEIARCKDCKHKYIEDNVWKCPFGLSGGENFFCGYGSLGRVEMRTDE